MSNVKWRPEIYLKTDFVTKSKLALLAARQTNKSETRCWGKE